MYTYVHDLDVRVKALISDNGSIKCGVYSETNLQVLKPKAWVWAGNIKNHYVICILAAAVLVNSHLRVGQQMNRPVFTDYWPFEYLFILQPKLFRLQKTVLKVQQHYLVKTVIIIYCIIGSNNTELLQLPYYQLSSTHTHPQLNQNIKA